MAISELKERLIDKIRKTDNEEDDLYELSAGQRNAINEGREQITSGDFLTDAQADREIEEWLVN